MSRMGKMLLAGCCVLLLVHISLAQKPPIYKLCVPLNKAAECENLQRADSEVSCVLVQDSTDCALKLRRDEVDFGVFTAEQMLVAGQFLDQNDAAVMGDVRDGDKRVDDFAFTSVAVARRKSISGKLGPNMKLCHPGVGRTRSGWSDRVLKELDLAALDSVNGRRCDEWRSALDNEISSIAQFWGPSCRPGRWSLDDEADKRLKGENPKLCERCPDKAGCSYGTQDSDPHVAALKCLRDGGDVAFVDVSYATEFITGMTSTSEWALLCPDLTLSTNVTSCKWSSQSWSGVAARREVSYDLGTKLNGWLSPLAPRELGVTEPPARRTGGWIRALSDIILGDYQAYQALRGEPSMKQFIARGRKIPDAEKEENFCRGPIRWCSLQEAEREKCNWMATAALAAGVVPPVKCLGAETGLACAKLLAEHQADLVVTGINEAHMASEMKIDVNKFVETSSDRHRIVVALVRHDNTRLRNITDLKDMKACFPVIDGIAYGTFLKEAMKEMVLSGACPYGVAVDEFFGDSCVPGASDNETNPAGLCELCQANSGSGGFEPYSLNKPPQKCAAHEGNLFYGDAGALRCLHSGGGDVAYVELRAARDAIKDQGVSGIKEEDFRVMCNTGNFAGSGTGLEGAEACAQATLPSGAALMRAKETVTARRDVHNTLVAVDGLFGLKDSSHPAPSFHLYRAFNGTKGLIFPEGTVGLLDASDSKVEVVKEYIALTAGVPKPCGTGGYSAATPASVPGNLFLAFVALLVLLGSMP